jgi:hypothetical protein
MVRLRSARSIGLIWFSALVFSDLGGAVAAEPAGTSTEPSAADRDTARALMSEGDRRFGLREYREALALYEQAYRRVRVPTVGLAVAKAQAALGLLIEARMTAKECVRSPVREGEPKVFAQARLDAGDFERRVGQRIPSVLIELVPIEAVASLEIDGRDAASARQAALELNPGQHLLRATAAGFVDSDQSFHLREGEPRKLRVVLQPEAVTAAKPAIAAAPLASVAANESAPSSHTPSEAGTSGAAVRGYVALGVAAIGIAAGSTAGLLAFSSKPDCPRDVCPPGSDSDIKESKQYGTIANVSFIVAGVAGLYGLWELAINAPSAARTTASGPMRTTIAPTLSAAGDVGLSVRGGF